ncbi:hypothetical protein HY025_01315 [Candidatus Daviesbacteria bacterium]|nr:hypothetical protein [Candidatus Daviesbacteria bacterium]
MSDGGKSGVSGLVNDIGEAVGTPVVNEAKEIIKETFGSITGSTQAQLDPQTELKKKQDEEKQKRYWKEYLANVANAQNAIRAKQDQEKQTKAQVEDQEKEQKQVKKIVLEQKRQKQNVDLTNKQRFTERKIGTG